MPQKITVVGGGPTAPGPEQVIDPSFNALRSSLRPLDTNLVGQTLGHYRAVTKSGAVNTISAAGILASLYWADPSHYLVLHRLAAILEITAAITVATPLDLQAFVFRGGTAVASGSGSSVLTFKANNQKTRVGMGASLFSANGEIRTIGTTTALTAVASKANDAAPFGAAMFGTQIAPNVGATANVTAPIGALVTGWQDLYSVQSPYQHPIVLSPGEGIEVQVITATPTTGGVNYAFLWEWAEVAQF